MRTLLLSLLFVGCAKGATGDGEVIIIEREVVVDGMGGGYSAPTSSPTSSTTSYNTSTSTSTTTTTTTTSSTTTTTSTSTAPPLCHPIYPQTVCGNGYHCIPQPNGTTICEPGIGAGEQCGPCNENYDCEFPYACVDVGMSWPVCLQWCSDISDCLGTESCVPMEPPVYVGTVQWGVCLDLSFYCY